MTDDDRARPEEPATDTDELAQAGGVGLGAGEPSTFEPEEDPESVPPDASA
jgi:hypothetical protein